MIHRIFLTSEEFNIYCHNTLYDMSIRGTLWEMYTQLCDRHGHYDMMNVWHSLMTTDGKRDYTFEDFREDCVLENIRFAYHEPNTYDVLTINENYHIESYDVEGQHFYALSEY